MKTGSIDRATSLNAPVRPWKSSRMWRESFSTRGIGSSAGKRERRRSTAALRTSSGKSSKSESRTNFSAAPRVKLGSFRVDLGSIRV